MSQPSCARLFLIEGRVQGVFYRASARSEAERLGLDGWIRNLDSGAVEAYARGSEAALVAFETWLRKGPPRAEVRKVTVKEVLPEALPRAGFSIR